VSFLRKAAIIASREHRAQLVFALRQPAQGLERDLLGLAGLGLRHDVELLELLVHLSPLHASRFRKGVEGLEALEASAFRHPASLGGSCSRA
jgi:hypothetical protein